MQVGNADALMTMAAVGRVLADVADHQDVHRNQRAPRDSKVYMHSHGAAVELVRGKEEQILNADEGHEGQHDGPAWNQLEIFAHRKGRTGICMGHRGKYIFLQVGKGLNSPAKPAFRPRAQTRRKSTYCLTADPTR